MLITKIKKKDELLPLIAGKTLVIVCQGCREVFLPSDEISAFCGELKGRDPSVEIIASDYLCNHDFTGKRVEDWNQSLGSAETIIVFSCGVGVQVLSTLSGKRMIAGLDTQYVQGFKGLIPAAHDCGQCGNCYLNFTGGICPLTACAKSLLNGQCGGAKNGKCEIAKEKECGWERIYRRLEKIGRLDLMDRYIVPRSYK